MSGLPSYAYRGFGSWAQENNHYSQAIRVGDRLICSGQGGWNPEQTEMDPENLIKDNLVEEIDQAFANVEHTIKNAGGKGWPQVYLVRTYSTNIEAQHQRIVENLKKWMPNHTPVWTEIGVKQLGVDAMHFEVEVEAFDPEGARKAGGSED